MTTWAIIGADLTAAPTAMAIEVAGETLAAVASHAEAAVDGLAAQTGARVVAPEAASTVADVVAVHSDAHEHARDVLLAVAGGASVMVAPPLAAVLADAARIVRVAEAGGRIVYGEHLIHAEAFAAGASAIAQLGPLTNLTVRCLRRPPTSAGAGLLVEVGSRALALAMRANGHDRAVAVTATTLPGRGGDRLGIDHAVVMVEFASGLRARLEVSWRSTSDITDIQAASDDGVVWLSMEPEVSLERNGERVPLASAAPGPHPAELDALGHVDLVRATVRAHEGVPSISTTRFGAEVLEIALAARRAAKSGNRVPIDSSGEHL